MADSRLTAFFRQEPEGNDINKYDHHFDDDTLNEKSFVQFDGLRLEDVTAYLKCWKGCPLTLNFYRFFLSIFNELSPLNDFSPIPFLAKIDWVGHHW